MVSISYFMKTYFHSLSCCGPDNLQSLPLSTLLPFIYIFSHLHFGSLSTLLKVMGQKMVSISYFINQKHISLHCHAVGLHLQSLSLSTLLSFIYTRSHLHFLSLSALLKVMQQNMVSIPYLINRKKSL